MRAALRFSFAHLARKPGALDPGWSAETDEFGNLQPMKKNRKFRGPDDLADLDL